MTRVPVCASLFIYHTLCVYDYHLTVLASPVQKGIGRLLVIVMEGRDVLASDANGKM